MLLQWRMSPGFQDPSESNGAVRNVEGPRGKEVEAGARRGPTSDCGVTLVDLRENICANQEPLLVHHVFSRQSGKTFTIKLPPIPFILRKHAASQLSFIDLNTSSELLFAEK